MRNSLISLAVAASALAVATPASAQYFPQPQGNAYGYNNYGHVRALQVRVNNLQRQINHFDRRNILSNREAARLRQDARELERRIYYSARNGLHPREAYDLERRIVRLEQRIHFQARDVRRGDRRGRDGGYRDRDRDGRPDRYEDDRGRDRDD